jgi:hypothetical protein
MKRVLILTALAILASACSSSVSQSASTTKPIDPNSVLVTVTQTGGCMMMGPNCPTYVVHANAQVMLLRTGGSRETVDSSFVDPALTTDLAWLISTTDFQGLRAKLPQGECQGCYDGIDTTFVFVTESSTAMFNSVEVKLDPAEPLFGAVWAIVDAANRSTEMPLEQR